MTAKDIRTPKVSSLQLVSVLVLARLFILLIFVPNTHYTAGGTVPLLAIVLGYLFTFAALLPLYFVLKKYPGMDIMQISMQLSRGWGYLSGMLFYLSCMAVAVETAAQFTMFLTTVVYPRASSVMISFIFCIAAVYMVLLGLEAVSRGAVVLLFLTIVSSLLIGFGLVRFGDSLNLISPLYEGVGNLLYASMLYFTQNVELVAFVLLLSNLNTDDFKRAFLGYHTFVNLILWIVAFAAITALGSYGGTRSFPVYTLFALAGSNVFYRFDYVLVGIWVGVSLIRTAVYLILAGRLLNDLSGRRLHRRAHFINAAVLIILSGIAAGNLKFFKAIYRTIASGLPVYLLVVLLPFVLLLLNKRKGVKGNEAV